MKKIFSRITSLVLLFAMFSGMLLGCREVTVIPTPGDTQNQTSTKEPSSTSNIPVNTETSLPESPKTEESPAILITELMALNTAGIKDADGKYSSWIEFYNCSEQDVLLSDYTLVVAEKGSFDLPSKKLVPGEYFVVFANGTENENSIPLSLSSKGSMTLMHGELISAKINYANLNANHSYITFNGSETSLPTPGYDKAKERDNLVISELMSSNSLYPINGVDCDWIEIVNLSEYKVDLSEYYITTNIATPYKEKLPSVVLDKGEYLLIACGTDVTFNLSKSGESVYITRNDGVLAASVTFDALEKNTSWTYDKGVVDYPSPYFENTKAGNMKAITSRKGLVISEVISSNKKYSKFNGVYCDIVELYNNTDGDILLSDYYLSDKGSELKRYQLPAVTLGAGKYYTVYCDSAVSGAAPFGISADGENLFVSKEDGYIVDALFVPSLPQNISWGRSGEQLVYFSKATIGAANGKGYDSITSAPVANISSGIFTEAQSITLSGEGVIYYTLNGTKPTKNSTVYNGETIVVDKNTSIRAVAYDGDKIPSDIVTFNYFIDIPEYELPIIKISVDHEEMFGENGIYTNYTSHEEIEGNLAMYVNGVEEFSINCGVKLHGAGSRKYTKKSFQLEFRGEYGASRLEYPLFGDDYITTFDNIVLRSGSQNLFKSDSMMTDEFVTSLAMSGGEMNNVFVQAYRPCNVYVNGEYYGVYFIREKIDCEYFADHLGISEESVSIITYLAVLHDGASMQGWDQIWDAVYNKKLDLSINENYKLIADQLNLESFIDVIIMRMYSGDGDLKNIRAFKSEEYDGGRWNFILFDNDMSFRAEDKISQSAQRFLTFSDYKTDHALLRALMQNEQFKALFLERLALHLNTTLTTDNAHARLDEMVKEIEHDMQYQIDRWNDDSFYVDSMKKWRANVKKLYTWTDDIRREWFVKDIAKALGLTKEDIGLYMGEEFMQYVN